MIVVDVNVIAYLLIAGEKTAEARAMRDLDADWLVPDLWRDEFLNILSTYVRHGGTSLETATALWLSAVAQFEGKDTTADPITTLQLAARHQLSAYDAQYLVVAIDHDVRLITEDKAMLKAVPQRCMTMRDFIDANTRAASGE